MSVDIVFERSGLRRGRGNLERFAEAVIERTLEGVGWPEADLTVLFCSESHIQKLNRQFRDLDAPTDVLSFPATENPEELRGYPDPYLGDVAVCLPYAAREAKKRRKPMEEEVALLLVHGVLHLLGWDHGTEKQEKAMWARQDELLAAAADVPRPQGLVLSS